MSSEPTTPENLRAATRPGTSICHRRWSKLFQECLFDQCGNTTLAFAILRLSVHLFLPRDLSLSLCDHQTLAPTRMRKAGSQPRDPYVSCRVSVSFLFNRMLITGLWRWALILSSQKTDWQFQESALRSPSHGKWQAASSMPTLGPPIVCLASLGSFSCEARWWWAGRRVTSVLFLQCLESFFSCCNACPVECPCLFENG